VELYFHSPNTPSWCGAKLSTGTTLPLPKLPKHTRYLFVHSKGKLYQCLSKMKLIACWNECKMECGLLRLNFVPETKSNQDWPEA
jgi:hypothetical protein